MENKILNCIIDTAISIKETRKLKIDIDKSTYFTGDKGIFDSLDLINFIILLEKNIEKLFNKKISLTNMLANSEQVKDLDVKKLLIYIQGEL